MQNDNSIHVATIGAFGHWSYVLDEMADMDNVELVAAAPSISGEDLGAITRHRAASKNIVVFDSHRLLIEKVQPDIVILSCRLDCISGIAMEAAQAGCDIISEKPLALSLRALENLHRAVSVNDVRLMAMLNMRSDPVFQTARRVFQSGAIGEVVLANVRKSYKYGSRPDWFGSREKYGGTMLWVGIHALDIIQFITGRTFTSVAAIQRNFAHPQRPDCEDCVAAVFGLDNGAAATVSVDLLRPENAPTHGDDWIRIVGTLGTLEACSNDLTVRLLQDNSEGQKIPLDPVRPLYRSFLSRKAVDDELMEPEIPFLLTHACLCARDAADAGEFRRIPSMSWSKTPAVAIGGA
ncbi:MAG TPA: Gfo/Idh/MocA family oxidoreductase [Verrucomicrobiae bacterium]|nr:Gfo/Idh/MocA family oxidoreductase [Verrucomicrobiae bacterium]